MKIKNLKIYGLDESIIRSGYPHQIGEPIDLYFSDGRQAIETHDNSINRAKKLANTPIGSGHNNFLIGITVQFDLCYPQYWTKHLQRYHWFQYFSGQSLMHKLTSVKDIYDNCNKYVLPSIIQEVNYLIEWYNTKDEYPLSYPCNIIDDNYNAICVEINSKEDMFHYIISNCPMGYELWVPVTTNYMQLKTMYHQRKSHKLYDWKEFCDWIKTLPMSELIWV